MYNAATSLMVEDIAYMAGAYFIVVTWSTPKYRPLVYKLNSVCNFYCGRTPYINKNSNRNYRRTSHFIKDIRPGSNCVITLMSVYNYASLDKGVSLNISTRIASKFKEK